MSQAAYEAFCRAAELWRLVFQAVMLFVLWKTLFGFAGDDILRQRVKVKPYEVKNALRDARSRAEKRRDTLALGAAAAANIVTGVLSCSFWIRYVISAAILLGYCLLCRRKQTGKAVFLLTAFYSFHSLSSLISIGIYTKAMNVWQKDLDVTGGETIEQLYFYFASGLVLMLLTYTVFFVLEDIVTGKIIKRDATMEWQDVLLLSVLNLVGGILANIVTGLLTVEIEQGIFSLFDEKPDLLWKLPLTAVLVFAGEAALIYFWQRYQMLLFERQKHFAEEQQVKAMKQRLTEAEGLYGSVRKVRHEMKNHMANLRGLAESGQYKEIEAYLREMDAVMQKLEYRYTTGNAVTDVILNDKGRQAEKAGIRFEAEFRYGGEIPVFDLGIILNNLLDNAIEACGKLEPERRFIRLTARERKQFLLLTVENSFDGAAPGWREDSLPATTKKASLPGIVTEHGIGLENVRDVAERYFGGVSIKAEGTVFHVTVLLQKENKEVKRGEEK